MLARRKSQRLHFFSNAKYDNESHNGTSNPSLPGGTRIKLYFSDDIGICWPACSRLKYGSWIVGRFGGKRLGCWRIPKQDVDATIAKDCRPLSFTADTRRGLVYADLALQAVSGASMAQSSLYKAGRNEMNMVNHSVSCFTPHSG